MDFGIMFFSSAEQTATDKYGLLLDAARYADEHGFCSVWTPERHFHQFGGLFPNPSVTNAALAMITRRLQLRAGSLVSPLHDAIRIAEEWAVVDNLSGGRVAISFGSGWNVDDFLFFPDRYGNRHAIMYEQIETIRSLWQGGRVTRRNSFGKEIGVVLYPQPVQSELPVWVTTSGNVETFKSAGAIGANVLTHLIGQDVTALAAKIQAYRDARAAHGFDAEQGKVSLMLHTFLGADVDEVRRRVHGPFRDYIRSAVSLETQAANSGGVISGGHKVAAQELPADVLEELLELTFERYFKTAALMGTPASCRELVWQLQSVGVDEIACLIDFIDDRAAVLESLVYLNELRESCSTDEASATATLDAFVEDLEEFAAC
jgi:natural product biosynthesis luciferase-like monooxygenase protein